jgi:hypothetical protein
MDCLQYMGAIGSRVGIVRRKSAVGGKAVDLPRHNTTGAPGVPGVVFYELLRTAFS